MYLNIDPAFYSKETQYPQKEHRPSDDLLFYPIINSHSYYNWNADFRYIHNPCLLGTLTLSN